MPQLDDDGRSKVKDIVCEILEIEPEEVTETSSFADDHGADSLRAIEILAALESEMGVVIEQSELSRMGTLAGVYEVVTEARANHAAGVA